MDTSTDSSNTCFEGCRRNTLQLDVVQSFQNGDICLLQEEKYMVRARANAFQPAYDGDTSKITCKAFTKEMNTELLRALSKYIGQVNGWTERLASWFKDVGVHVGNEDPLTWQGWFATFFKLYMVPLLRKVDNVGIYYLKEKVLEDMLTMCNAQELRSQKACEQSATLVYEMARSDRYTLSLFHDADERPVILTKFYKGEVMVSDYLTFGKFVLD